MYLNKSNMTIKEMLLQYINKDNQIFISGGGNLKTNDLKNILSVLDETLDNFIIIDNAGGRKFHIWKKGSATTKSDGTNVFDNIESLEKFLYNDINDTLPINHFTYAYKINGKEVILKKL